MASGATYVALGAAAARGFVPLRWRWVVDVVALAGVSVIAFEPSSLPRWLRMLAVVGVTALMGVRWWRDYWRPAQSGSTDTGVMSGA